MFEVAGPLIKPRPSCRRVPRGSCAAARTRRIEELVDESVAIRMADRDVRGGDARRQLRVLRPARAVQRDVAALHESQRRRRSAAW